MQANLHAEPVVSTSRVNHGIRRLRLLAAKLAQDPTDSVIVTYRESIGQFVVLVKHWGELAYLIIGEFEEVVEEIERRYVELTNWHE